MRCRFCGHKEPDTAQWCSNCGEQLSGERIVLPITKASVSIAGEVDSADGGDEVASVQNRGADSVAEPGVYPELGGVSRANSPHNVVSPTGNTTNKNAVNNKDDAEKKKHPFLSGCLYPILVIAVGRAIGGYVSHDIIGLPYRDSVPTGLSQPGMLNDMANNSNTDENSDGAVEETSPVRQPIDLEVDFPADWEVYEEGSVIYYLDSSYDEDAYMGVGTFTLSGSASDEVASYASLHSFIQGFMYSFGDATELNEETYTIDDAPAIRAEFTGVQNGEERHVILWTVGVVGKIRYVVASATPSAFDQCKSDFEQVFQTMYIVYE